MSAEKAYAVSKVTVTETHKVVEVETLNGKTITLPVVEKTQTIEVRPVQTRILNVFGLSGPRIL